MQRFDVAVVGAGAAGLFCAALAGQRGLRVVLIEHAATIGEKIRISGGGRCNFTNVDAADERRYVSAQPRFARAALRAFGPDDFVALVRRHGIGFHEKHRGQLFCDESSQAIIAMLRAECDRGRVQWRHPVRVRAVRPVAAGEAGAGSAGGAARDGADGGTGDGTGGGAAGAGRFRIACAAVGSDEGAFEVVARSLVVATGGLSVPAIGATDFAWVLARRLGIDVVAPQPALVPFTFAPAQQQRFASLAGLALPVRIGPARRGVGPEFDEDLLFTHRGLSGPAALQVSSYWDPGDTLRVDLAPGLDLAARLVDAPGAQTVANRLAEHLPRRLAQALLDPSLLGTGLPARAGALPPIEVAHAVLRRIGALANRWELVPDGTEGYRKAEATRGGIDTRELDPRSLQCRRLPGLYFIGEAVDVTGWLGGYNFQWAWSSAHAAALALADGA